MQEIHIYHIKDLEKLKEVKKNEYIYLKVHCSLEHKLIESINLSQFRGTIDVSFDNDNQNKKFYQFQVLVDEYSKANQWIFTNAKHCMVLFPQNMQVETTHQKKPHIKISTSLEWQKFFTKPICNAILELQNDITISGRMKDCHDIEVLGNGHYVYANSKKVAYLEKQKGIFFRDVHFMVVDKIVFMKHFDDLKVALKYPNGRVAVSLENDIQDTFIRSISLKKFFGTFIFLGEGHKISNVQLIDSHRASLGLFSNISYQANFVCSDLTLFNIMFPIQEYLYVGCILGSRRALQKSKYLTMPGRTLITNCQVLNTSVLKGKYETGVFVGYDETCECIGCQSRFVNGVSEQEFVGSQFYFPDIAKEENLSSCKVLARIKDEN